MEELKWLLQQVPEVCIEMISSSNKGNNNYIDGGNGDDVVGAGALTGDLRVTLTGVSSYDAIAPYWLYYYPQNIYANYAAEIGQYLLYYGSQITVGNLISRGGIVPSGLNDVGNTLQVMSKFTKKRREAPVFRRGVVDKRSYHVQYGKFY